MNWNVPDGCGCLMVTESDGVSILPFPQRSLDWRKVGEIGESKLVKKELFPHPQKMLTSFRMLVSPWFKGGKKATRSWGMDEDTTNLMPHRQPANLELCHVLGKKPCMSSWAHRPLSADNWKLVIVNGKMNEVGYKEVLEKSQNVRLLTEKFTFTQDNNLTYSKHIAIATIEACSLNNGVK